MKSVFEAPEAQPNLVSLAAVTGGTVEINLWTPPQWTPIATGPGSNNYATPGQFWVLEAHGAGVYAATPGTTAFTARIGTSSTPGTNTILGAASAAVTGTTAATAPWYLRGILVVRSVGLPGANSVVFFRGHWSCPLALQAAGSQGGVVFGGTATVDLSVAQALAVSVTPSVTTQSFTPDVITWRSVG